jgi:ribokinase
MLVCQLEIALPAVARAVDLATELGVKVILNPAPAGPTPEGLFAKATVLTPNETEAEFFSGVALPAEAALASDNGQWERAASAKLLNLGPQVVVITLGQRGAYLAVGQRGRIISGFQVVAADATAAGDAFNGALAVALAEGKDMEQAGVFANAAGALTATQVGAQSSLPTRAEVEKLIRKNIGRPVAGAPATEGRP